MIPCSVIISFIFVGSVNKIFLRSSFSIFPVLISDRGSPFTDSCIKYIIISKKRNMIILIYTFPTDGYNRDPGNRARRQLRRNVLQYAIVDLILSSPYVFRSDLAVAQVSNQFPILHRTIDSVNRVHEPSVHWTSGQG